MLNKILTLDTFNDTIQHLETPYLTLTEEELVLDLSQATFQQTSGGSAWIGDIKLDEFGISLYYPDNTAVVLKSIPTAEFVKLIRQGLDHLNACGISINKTTNQ